jgi:hypothetical protein
MVMARKNPWERISLNDYEEHMKLEQVSQLQTLNQIMKEQIEQYQVSSLAILGIAGGNGLEHVSPQQFKTVYGVDINADYLKTCKQRYPDLKNIFIPICIDLNEPNATIPDSELVIANLFIEYIGIDSFVNKINYSRNPYVSCVIQENKREQFVSKSPYAESFASLKEIHTDISKGKLIKEMYRINYAPILGREYELPNGKMFHRMDFKNKL